MPKGVFVRTPEHLERLKEQARRINGGRPLSETHRERLRIAWRSRTDAPWNKGKKTGPLTADHRAKIGAAGVGRIASDQCRQAIGRAHTTHGHTRNGETPTYYIWCAMQRRCFNANTKDYPNYGGRGITVCDRWRQFENFLADMGERPQGLSIDRFPNNDGNYEPGNVRWATPKEQANNRRKARR